MPAPRGRPTKYKQEYVDQARKLCKLGATDMELADFFEVNVDTVYRWKSVHEDFSEALKTGKEDADDRVERSLYHRATGYSFDAVKIFQHAGKPVKVPYREHVPPDTTAMIFWLKNRRPEQWRDKREVDWNLNRDAADLSDSELADIARSGSEGAAKKANGANGSGRVH